MSANLPNLRKWASQNGDASKVDNNVGTYWSEFIKAMILDFSRSFGSDSLNEFINNDPTRETGADASNTTSGIIGYAISKGWLTKMD